MSSVKKLFLAVMLSAFAIFIAPASELQQPDHGSNLAPPSSIPADSLAFKGLRDPFWPVGYQPKEAQSTTPAAKSAPIPAPQAKALAPLEWPPLQVKGITRSSEGHRIAIIAGIGLVEPGSIITMQHKGYLFRWRVESVDEQGITYSKLGATAVGTRVEEKEIPGSSPSVRRWDEDINEPTRNATNVISAEPR
ncbi:MAG: hypothetical protein ACUVWX_14110 [Kiritimatiellia bacterium]